MRDKLPLVFTDLGPQTVKNIARPVRSYGLDAEAVLTAPRLEPPAAGRPQALPPRSDRRLLLALCGLMAVGAGGGGAAWVLTRRTPAPPSPVPSPGRQQIAVMPLLTIGGGDDYFASGLTEDLIAALGRFPELAVRARSAVIAYKEHPATPAEIGRALAVRYLVDGSVRRVPDRVRVSISLTDTGLGTLLWSETYDAEAKDIFAVQDSITQRIAGSLSARLDTLAIASATAKPPGQLEAYDLVLRGRARLDLVTRVGTSEARTLFERAIALDPNYAAAYVGHGRANVQALEEGWTGDPEGTEARATADAQKAVALEADSPTAHALLGRILARSGNYDAALNELKRALTLNPSDAETLASYGDVLTWAGDAKGAIPYIEEAARFRPNRQSGEYVVLGLAYFLAGRPADAAQVLEQISRRAAPLVWFSVLLAACYAQLERPDDAAREAANVRLLDPSFDPTVAGFLFRRPEDRAALRTALKRAGL